MMEEKFEHWLPFFVNGTLGAAERAEMERYLATDPAARADVSLFSNAAIAMNAKVNRASERIGLDKAIALNRAWSPEETRRSSILLNTEESFATKLRDWFGGSWLQPAFALALVVIGVQTAMMFRADETIQMRGASPTTATASRADVTYLRVSFAPTATEGELRVLLAGSNASFAAGPDSNGAYTLSVPNDQAVIALERLRASRVVVAANPSERP